MKTILNRRERRLLAKATLATGIVVAPLGMTGCDKWPEDCTQFVCEQIAIHAMSFIRGERRCCQLPEVSPPPNPCPEVPADMHCCSASLQAKLDQASLLLSQAHVACIQRNKEAWRDILAQLTELLKKPVLAGPGIGVADDGRIGNNLVFLAPTQVVEFQMFAAPTNDCSALPTAKVDGKKYLIEAAGPAAQHAVQNQGAGNTVEVEIIDPLGDGAIQSCAFEFDPGSRVILTLGGTPMIADIEAALSTSEFVQQPDGSWSCVPTVASLKLTGELGDIRLLLDTSCPHNHVTVQPDGVGALRAAFTISASDLIINEYLSIWETVWLDIPFVNTAEGFDFSAILPRNGLQTAPSVLFTQSESNSSQLVDCSDLPVTQSNNPCDIPPGSRWNNGQIWMFETICYTQQQLGCQ